MIITVDNFTAEIAIGQSESDAVKYKIDEFIEKYEPIFLKWLLGKTLANEFVDGLLNDPDNPKWESLKDDIIVPLSNFVYVKYQENEATQVSGAGEVVNESVNSTRKSPIKKIVRAWNEMVDHVKIIQAELCNSSEYSSFEFLKTEIQAKRNVLGI